MNLIGKLEGITQSFGSPWRAIWIDGFLPSYEELRDTERMLIRENKVSSRGRKRAARDRLFRKLLADLIKDYQIKAEKEGCFNTICIIEGLTYELAEQYIIQPFDNELWPVERKRKRDYRYIIGIYDADQCLACTNASYDAPLCLKQALKELNFDVRKIIGETTHLKYDNVELRRAILKSLEEVYNYPARVARKRLEYLGFIVKQEIFFE